LVQAKGKGREVVTDHDEEPSAEVVDLMEALRKSVEAAKSRKSAGNKASAQKLRTQKADAEPKKSGERKRTTKKTPAKRPAKKAATTRQTTRKPAKRTARKAS
ncbi:MAG TPA: Ku protein, partial [Sporichthya sp.]|nr:Ku protein [Sporichthya sp.]